MKANIGKRQTFHVHESLPTMNEIILASSTILKGNRRIGSKYSLMKKKYDKLICEAIKMAGIVPVGAFTAEFLWFEKNRRKDPDNIAVAVKFIFDALQKSGIIEGDGWKYNKGWSNTFIVGQPYGVEVIIIS